ncbi:uncharacterized protein LOC135849836 [Planococcus citri]|uniref:uncharacterized protein LOC135849836 n=1 Tax=Planococcus citri TaxID=170843 RepID=UPI0031F7FA7B
MNKCKITQTGIEYAGDISHTESGAKCQEWGSLNPSTHIHDPLNDNDFPEGSPSRAKNFCRNVKGISENPWCYTVNKDLNDEICNIPLCNFDCRRTLIGAEYGGQVSVSLNGRLCQKWSEKTYRKYLRKINSSVVTDDRLLLDEKFPELSRKKASNYCRNPTMDPNGPWCLVEDDFLKTDKYEKEYCDVGLCYKTDCTAGTNRFTEEYTYSHFHSINASDSSLKFSILLWNTDFENSTFRIGFSVYPLPVTGRKLADMDNGIELLISKHGLGFIEKTGKKVHWKDVHNLLSSYEKKTFIVDWFSPRISVTISQIAPLDVIYDFQFANKIITVNKGQFKYYSIIGDPALWDLPCSSKCREEITIHPDCNFHRKLNKIEDNYLASFVVRSDQTIYIELRDSPNSKFPYLKIEIFGTQNKTFVGLYSYLKKDSTPQPKNCGTFSSILSYWSWTQFRLSSSGDTLQLVRVHPSLSPETICTYEDVVVANAKWFSICSKGTAHWMFECDKLDILPLPANQLPECVVQKKGETYKGSMNVSASGQPCFPWIYDELDKYTAEFHFGSSNKREIVNYCRNLIGDDDGPFCYVADVDKLPELSLKKESCNIRFCPISQCKVTGLGSDYVGDLSTTRTNRTCENWSLHSATITQKLQNNSIANNKTIVNLQKNYCRNPNNGSFGPWCYTTDKNMPIDLCYIRDCSHNDAFTLINMGTESNSRIYMRPEWVTESFNFFLRSWDPHTFVGVALKISFDDAVDYFVVEIGAENSTKVKLSHVDENGSITVLKESIIAKLIPTGYWQGFWLGLPPNDIEIGYYDSSNAIFSWSNTQDSGISNKYSRYVSFSNLGSYSVGIHFQENYCLIHQVYADFQSGYYPFNFGNSAASTPSKMSFYLRNDRNHSKGHALIKFFGESEVDFISFMINSTHMLLQDENNSVLNHIYFKGTLLSESWIFLTISYTETYINVQTNLDVELSWHSSNKRLLRLYYFSITAHDTTISWLSNCEPPLEHENVTDGGFTKWSTWICNVRCGGGLGHRFRNCTNPEPDFRGKPCIGATYEDGECNKFECGCINPVTYDKINSTLESQALNREANSGQDVIFQCERSIVEDIKQDSPGSYFRWLKNGYKINNEKLKFGDTAKLEETDLKLRKVTEEDTGIYMCVIYPDCATPNNLTFVPVTIVAFVVNSDQAHDARETTNYQIRCKGLILSFIYVELSQFWELDNELMIDYTIRPLDEVDMDFISEVEPSHTGIWTCKVTQNRLKLTWTTNRFRLNGS